MQVIKRFIRLIHIYYVVLKHGLDEIILNSPWLAPIRFLKHLTPATYTKKKHTPRGVRIREAIEELGPIFVKFGQILSTRLDVIPPDIVKEITKLQDNVPQFDGRIAASIIEKSFSAKIDDLFVEFDYSPLASASIAQVHAAKLKNGKDVVVKVLRPKIHKQIKNDIALFEILAKLACKFSKFAKRLKAKDMVLELKKYIFDELDLMREAANASQLRRNFSDTDILYVPEVYWDYCNHDVLVLERVYGIQVSNIAELRKHNVNLKLLAERGVEIFFTQVFRDCYFHADMHPGNVWVDIRDPKDPKYIALDFGIVGSLSSEDQRYIAENLLAFFNRDYRKVAVLHIESGWVPKHVRVDEFEAEIRTVSEPIFGRPLAEISFGKTLLRLFQAARKFDMNVQPQLILLQKTLLSVEGLGRQLYPQLDLWSTAKPFLEQWMKSQIGTKSIIDTLLSKIPKILDKLPNLKKELAKVIS